MNNVCAVTLIDIEKVERVKNNLVLVKPSTLVQLFKILSEENRFKILFSLSSEDRMCVCDLANVTESTIAATSHHLRALDKMGIIEFERVGKLVYYFIKDHNIKKEILSFINGDILEAAKYE